jgi:hypothetical protein
MSFRVEGLFVLSGEIENRVEIEIGNWVKHKKTHFFLNDIISIFDAYYFLHYHHKLVYCYISEERDALLNENDNWITSDSELI